MKKLFLAAALMLFAIPAHAASIRLCTGAADQPYAAAGDMIKAEARGNGLDIEVVKDTGGTWGNVQLSLQTKCDAIIAQPDGLAYLKRTEPANAAKFLPIADLHREYLHALCGKDSGVDDIGDLENDPKNYSIALGERGSGAWLIWQNFIAEDPDYADVRPTAESGEDALSAVANGQTTCMLVPAALGNAVLRTADELYGDSLVLVGVNDSDFNDAPDSQGKPLYSYAEIPSGTYPKHLQGWFSGKDTVTWLAKVYVNTDTLADANVRKALIRSVMKSRQTIVANFGS
ncbi:C4-dicarboxylate ABC transporter substrate-binding protein [Rhizobium ruizarguesonis]|uniref:TAXI family TRAP transporter solute-binding subunit n=1 Tax=Rhizobium ruizarguesonis TaxID=2081791 RepID=UPI00163AE9DF|nr:TAXI family TRAP transporter solute-binding subunit [Rhizobium ruizarguesonis]MBC2806603.1 C4-dicarboxylate ABC transporter substrate-binding protein [Rhizobium ruizarguesonis]